MGSIPWIKLGTGEWRWVKPRRFFHLLPEALAATPPLPGEEALYALIGSVLDAAHADRSMRKVLKEEAAAEADATLVAPLLQFRNFGIPLTNNWTTVVNSAEFGTDYFTRTAVAHSNTFINRPREARYFYQDLDRTGARLAKLHTDLPQGRTPPGQGFLVANPLQQGALLRAERACPLLRRHQEPRARVRRQWLANSLRAARASK